MRLKTSHMAHAFRARRQLDTNIGLSPCGAPRLRNRRNRVKLIVSRVGTLTCGCGFLSGMPVSYSRAAPEAIRPGTLQLELLDQRFATEEAEASRIDLETYQCFSNSLRRLLETLGLQRRMRDVTPSWS